MMPSPYHEYSRQQAAERVSKAYREGLAKETRHAPIGATRRALATTGAMMAWMIRLFGGGGSKALHRPRPSPDRRKAPTCSLLEGEA